MLGICYGMQLMVHELGGKVEQAPAGEFGRSELTLTGEGGKLLSGLPAEQQCWMSHRDTVFEAPPGFDALASSPESPVAAFEDIERGLYGIQFHPEVVHTPYGSEVLDPLPARHRWLQGSLVAGLGDRRAGRERFASRSARRGRSAASPAESTPPRRRSWFTSAIGDRLTCVFVDHGMMRKDEATQVVEAFRDRLGVHADPRRRR